MLQAFQNLTDGKTLLMDLPCPKAKRGHLVIRTRTSLISSGTERMLVDFAKANLIEKALQQPERVKSVLAKLKTDGFFSTYEAVKSRLDEPLPLGYSNVGEVIEVGPGIEGFSVGDRVVSNGHHAEIVHVPKNLCAKIPNEVSDETATFTVLGAIALQGVRLAQPTLGETFVVTGLGLLGLLTVQILRANGCRAIGLDYNKARCDLARQFGVEAFLLDENANPISMVKDLVGETGVDGVLITAATTSHDPVHHAAQMCRKRGRIVLVGVTGLNLQRSDFFEKELTFQVSCSYGPGRYDPHYEEAGNDYPIGFVRWTEQRNFEAILGLMKDNKILTQPIVSHRYELHNIEGAYKTLSEDNSAMGIILQYSRPKEALVAKSVTLNPQTVTSSEVTLGIIGTGNYATRVLMPAFKKAGARMLITSSTGKGTGVNRSRTLGVEAATTDYAEILQNPEINTVVIATPHNSHANLVCEALTAGKHVFVEKPLAINQQGLRQVQETYTKTRSLSRPPLLMIGFNRRFAPQVVKMKSLLDKIQEPKTFIMTVNAGAIPADNWNQNPEVGGGRIIGEGCHFVDLLRFLVGHPVTQVQATRMGPQTSSKIRDDKSTLTLSFADGSHGTIHYFANGGKSYQKERLEVFANGSTLQLNNFLKLKGFDWPGFSSMNLWRQDKGQMVCVEKFCEAIAKTGLSPIPFEEMLEVSEITINAFSSGG